MKDEDLLNLGVQNILGHQHGVNSNQSFNIGQTSDITPEQLLIESILDPRNIEIKGKYIIDSRGNEVPIVENIKSNELSKEGFPITFEKEQYFTQPDGTSFGDYVECMNCGEIVFKNNIFRCVGCSITCCVLCDTFSGKTQNHYCCSWHKIKCEGWF